MTPQDSASLLERLAQHGGMAGACRTLLAPRTRPWRQRDVVALFAPFLEEPEATVYSNTVAFVERELILAGVFARVSGTDALTVNAAFVQRVLERAKELDLLRRIRPVRHDKGVPHRQPGSVNPRAAAQPTNATMVRALADYAQSQRVLHALVFLAQIVNPTTRRLGKSAASKLFRHWRKNKTRYPDCPLAVAGIVPLIQTLADRGLLKLIPNGGVELTEKGYRLGRRIGRNLNSGDTCLNLI